MNFENISSLLTKGLERKTKKKKKNRKYNQPVRNITGKNK